MQKQFTKWSIVVVLIIGSLLNAQIGVNNSSPRATLDIQISTENLTTNTNEGLIPPQITKERLAQIADNHLVEGTIIYINDVTYTKTPANPKVAKVNEKGLYIYNKTTKEWEKLNKQGIAGPQGKKGERSDVKWVPIDEIIYKADRTRVTGTAGWWAQDDDGDWVYEGLVICLKGSMENPNLNKTFRSDGSGNSVIIKSPKEDSAEYSVESITWEYLVKTTAILNYNYYLNGGIENDDFRVSNSYERYEEQVWNGNNFEGLDYCWAKPVPQLWRYEE